MKDLTPSVATFENLIQGNFLYIDKTEFLWQLVEPARGIYFLSRPRRFGKSLALSTLKAIFHGKRELFKGLAIDSKPYNWKAYPVVHLDFNGRRLDTVDNLEESLRDMLQEQARNNHVPLERMNSVSMFNQLVELLAQKGQVVVLVDEYDKPILNHLDNPERGSEILAALKPFYSVLKAREYQVRFVFVTGVSKFCHVSLFSDLNNLQDISTDVAFATMLGYTQDELESNFSDRLPQVQQKLSLTREELLRRLKLWYDGFRFAPNAQTLYNPVSIANFFMRGGDFSNYWFSTGTASSLFALMQGDNISLPEIMEQAVSGELFDSFDLTAVDLQKLMYQTGYLTIGETEVVDAGTEYEEHFYHLRFPNKEVRGSFHNQVMEHFAGIKPAQTSELTRRLVADVKSGDVNSFMERLKVLFAKIPYTIHGRVERDYQSIFYVIFLMLNVHVQGECHTNEGRIDIVLSGGEWAYVIEVKLNGTTEEAMEQMERKDYARGYLMQGQRVVKVGVSFDKKRAQIDSWLAVELTSQGEEIPLCSSVSKR